MNLKKTTLFCKIVQPMFLNIDKLLYSCQSIVERTGAGVEWLTSVPEVPGSILSRGAFRCGLEQVTFHSSCGNGQKLIDSVNSKKNNNQEWNN